ncbi:ExbD/TolR family protein [Tistrella mobilis]|uniref:ExbD/TolR family protein n=1 Tax=Tistrella mobilis TaxID=171437 RepID=UPI0035571E92
MRLTRSRRRHGLAIGLTPLIDVVFILLLFFMLASSLADWRVLEVVMPEARPQAPPPPPSSTVRNLVVVAVAADGALSIDDEAVTPESLAQRLTARAAADPALRVHVRPVEAAPMQAVVSALEAAGQSGAASVEVRPR